MHALTSILGEQQETRSSSFPAAVAVTVVSPSGCRRLYRASQTAICIFPAGQVTNSQLFTFKGGSGPLPLLPQNGNNRVCLTINPKTNLVDQTSCSPASASGEEVRPRSPFSLPYIE